MLGLDPKKMQAMMKQLGIKQEEIPASKVIIEQEDKNIIIENPSISKVVMQGQESFQISGNVREEDKEQEISMADIKQVIEKTGKSESQARKALEQANGDLAEAILALSS